MQCNCGNTPYHISTWSLPNANIFQVSCEGENYMSYSLCDRDSLGSEIVLYNCQTLKILLVSNFFELQDSYEVPFKVIPSGKFKRYSILFTCIWVFMLYCNDILCYSSLLGVVHYAEMAYLSTSSTSTRLFFETLNNNAW